MSELSRQARRAMRAKIHRLTQGASGKIDASDYGPEEVLDAGIKTGLRPLSRRAFKKGGKVMAAEGEKPRQNAGKKPRNGSKHLTVDALVNRNVKDANEDREGIKHIGGMKSGGKVKKMGGGPLSGDATSGGDLYGMKNVGRGKTMLKKGGRACKEGGGGLGAMVGRKMAEEEAPIIRSPGDYKSRPISQPDPYERTPPKMPPPKPAVTRPDRDTLRGGPLKRGGRAEFEGSAKDEAQDKKLAKKYGMSMSKWEASAKDAKHDKQQSMKGLKKGGRAAKAHGGDISSLEFKKGGSVSDGTLEGTRPTGGRLARKSGGRAKGKTNINIVIGTGQRQPMPGGMMPPPGGPAGIPVPVPPAGGPPGMPPGMPPAMPPMPMGGPPPMMPPPGGGAGGPPLPPGMPMGRKTGGRVYRSYKDMDAGAGSGKGRLEKTEIQKHKR